MEILTVTKEDTADPPKLDFLANSLCLELEKLLAGC